MGLVPFLAAIWTWITGFAGALISLFGMGLSAITAIRLWLTLAYAAKKTIMFVLFYFVLPLILYNVVTRLMSDVAQLGFDYLSASGISGQTINIVGMGGWMAVNLMIVESIAILLTAVSTRFVLKLMKVA